MRITTIARFHCGCIHLTEYSALPMACPKHRAVLTGREHIRHELPETPRIRGLATVSEKSRMPLVLVNRPGESLTRKEIIKGDDWEDELSAEPGLCDACYIDGNTAVPVENTACGCHDPLCQYRWCGSTKGLHAFFRMHVRKDYGDLVLDPGEDPENLGEEALGRRNQNFDRDIFAHGP